MHRAAGISNQGFSQRRRLLAKTSTVLGIATVEIVRERYVPQHEVTERMWWAMSEALNTDTEPSFNGLGNYPAALADLYARLRESLSRFAPAESRWPTVVDHASWWGIRARDVEDSLRLAHIEESTGQLFVGPRLQMPLIAYDGGPRADLVRIGPQHEDPARLVELARRRVRQTSRRSQIGERALQDGLRQA